MSVPEEVALARAVRALRTGMVLTLATALALGVLASAILVLAGTPEAQLRLWPGLTTLLLGQVAALVAGVLAFVALQRALRPGADHRAARQWASGGLQRIPRPLFAALVLATTAWALVEPAAGLEALVGALVGAQSALPVTLAARNLDGSATAPGT
ncbi:MAG: hypothetical protein EOL89_03520 [Actinobacteria bacterium]|nr:hypothetical protein [Actinomycetota bacterium]